MNQTNYQRFLAGEYCNRLDTEVLEMINRTQKLLAQYNATETSASEKADILTQMLGKIGKYSSVGNNFTCQCGKHILIGEKTVINMNCMMMDENFIHIGNKVLIAPNVQFYTATHPVEAEERFIDTWEEGSEELFFKTKSLPITVEDNVWIGGGAILLPGVVIGKNSVIGAGSVVTKSIPPYSVAVGNPCRVIRRVKASYTFRSVGMEDIPELRGLFRSTVLAVNSRDYTSEEVMDWASCGDDTSHWERLLAGLHFIAALDGAGRIIGFTSIRSDGYLHSMFVHKDWQRKGVASALLSEIEKYGRAHHIIEFTSEVSITARPFFEKHGYIVEKEQKRQASRLCLTNYVMRKVL